jgi:DNA-binding MarR family transcriptional regulator
MRQSDLGRLLLEAFRAFEAETTEALAENGFEDIRPSFAAVFVHIEPEGTRPSELARRAGMTKQGMADIVEEMRAKGLVRRVDDPEDGRGRLVLLTAKGRRRLGQAGRAIERVEGRFRRHLGDRRYEALRSTLTALTGRAE